MLNYLPCTLIIADDVLKELAQFLDVELWFCGQNLRCLRVGQYRRQRLLQLVSERTGELAQHGNAGQMGNLLLLFERFRLRSFAVRIIDYVMPI